MKISAYIFIFTLSLLALFTPQVKASQLIPQELKVAEGLIQADRFSEAEAKLKQFLIKRSSPRLSLRIMMQIHSMLGRSIFLQGRFAEAITHLKHSTQTHNEIDNLYEIFVDLNYLGSALEKVNRYSEEIKIKKRILILAEKHFPKYVSEAKIVLALSFIRGDKKIPSNLHIESADISSYLGDHFDKRISSVLILSDYFDKNKRTEQSTSLLAALVNAAEEKGANNEWTAVAGQLLAAKYRRAGRYEDAASILINIANNNDAIPVNEKLGILTIAAFNYKDIGNLTLAAIIYKRIINTYINNMPLEFNINQVTLFLSGIAFDLEKIGANQEAAEMLSYIVEISRNGSVPRPDNLEFLSELAAESFFKSQKYYEAAKYQRLSIDLQLGPIETERILRKRLYLALYLGFAGDNKAAKDELIQTKESYTLFLQESNVYQIFMSAAEAILYFQNDQISEGQDLIEKIQPQLVKLENDHGLFSISINFIFSSLFKQIKAFNIANDFFARAELYATKIPSSKLLEASPTWKGVLLSFGAQLYFEQQDFARALKYSELHLAYILETSTNRPVNAAEGLRNIARIQFFLRDYDRAWNINWQGINLLLDKSLIRSDLYASLMADRFVILSSVGAYDASSVEREISRIKNNIDNITAHDPEDRDGNHARLLTQLGYAYLFLPDIDESRKYLKLAEFLLSKYNIQNYDNFYLFMNLAEVHIRSREYQDSLAYYFKALHILHHHGIPSDIHYSEVVNSIGATLSDLNRGDEGIAFLKEGINRLQTVRYRLNLADTEKLKLVTSLYAHNYAKLASLLNDQGRIAEAQMVLDMLKEDEQFEFIRRSAVADPRRTRIGYTPTEERWISRYREIADRLAALGREEQALQKLAKLGLTDEQKKRQAALVADLKVAQSAFEAFLEQMRQEFATKGPARSVEFAESSVKALAELQDLLKGLGDDVALLRIYLTDEQVNFLLTTPGVQLARNVKIKTQDLNRQVAEFNRLLRDPKSDPLPAAQALYKLLLAPVEQDLQQAGAKTVMLSLDGVLRYLPFGVLHDGQRYALQRWNLPVYTSVVRDRLRDTANANWQAAGLGVTRKHGNFDPLPAVRTEMSSIIRTGATGVLPGEVHLDEAFTAQRLKDVSQRRFPVVHVASHFQFSPGTEVNSFLLLGDGTQLTLGDIRTQNYRFDEVDLLTLSACDTGLGGGRDQRGREIEGFGVIAQQQGAKAVLASLWKVADSSTATLMGDMYRRRTQAGLSKIEALRQAQVSLAAQPRTAHPFYWAPFVLMGNWK